jgi:hypothetical protein
VTNRNENERVMTDSEVEPVFPFNYGTKSHKPGVHCDALDDAKEMAAETKDSAQKRSEQD